MLLQGNTRDGLWLIEKGKISKPIKNFRVTESPLFVLNSVLALGEPQRVFRPNAPAVCPAVMAQDFSFTGLMDAV
jgi:predicted Zn-dependent protease